MINTLKEKQYNKKYYQSHKKYFYEYRKAHAEKIHIYFAKYYLLHKDNILKKQKESKVKKLHKYRESKNPYYIANREKLCTQSLVRYHKTMLDPKKHAELDRQYRERYHKIIANKKKHEIYIEKHKARCKEYYKKNKIKILAAAKIAYAKKKAKEVEQ